MRVKGLAGFIPNPEMGEGVESSFDALGASAMRFLVLWVNALEESSLSGSDNPFNGRRLPAYGTLKGLLASTCTCPRLTGSYGHSTSVL